MNLIDKEEFYGIISSCIVNKRKELGLTQIDLANKAGMSRTSIVNIENGKQHPPLYLLWTIGNILDISPTELLPSQSFRLSTENMCDRSLKSSVLKKAKKEEIAQESILKINSFVLGI